MMAIPTDPGAAAPRRVGDRPSPCDAGPVARGPAAGAAHTVTAALLATRPAALGGRGERGSTAAEGGVVPRCSAATTVLLLHSLVARGAAGQRGTNPGRRQCHRRQQNGSALINEAATDVGLRDLSAAHSQHRQPQVDRALGAR